MQEGIIIPVAFFLSMFGILYVYFSTRNKERLAMIEKGFDPIKFKAKPENAGMNTLKWSLLMIGVAIGIFLGAILDEYADFPEEAAYFSCIFLFGGLGLFTAYLMGKKEEKK